jgi:DNA-binding transcriptional LysR family regulator
VIDFTIDTFLTVCRCLNFTKAAKELNITQPAVSQHIHYLEEFYNMKIFRFEGKKMYLTDEGNDLYINNLKNQKNRLVFGATLTIGEFVVARQLKSYLDLFPNSEICMILGNTGELLERLKSGEIDFALVEGNFNKKEYEQLTYSVERYIPICKKAYSFQKQPFYLKDLLTERIIVREYGSGTREILEKNLETRNLGIEDFRNMVEIGSMNAIKSLVEMGCGVTFMYEAAVQEELKKGTLQEIKLKDFQVSHDFTFIWNKGSIFSKNYQEICNILKS